jgi:oligosaccharyltransferase complex subunit epsilon
MAPKRANARDITPSSAATTQAGSTTAGSVPSSAAVTTKPHKTSLTTKDGWEQVVGNLWNHYLKTTPQRTKLIDAFMAFLAVVGALQFLYCILAGNYVSSIPPDYYDLGRMLCPEE